MLNKYKGVIFLKYVSSILYRDSENFAEIQKGFFLLLNRKNSFLRTSYENYSSELFSPYVESSDREVTRKEFW